jgi:hypothetical protein
LAVVASAASYNTLALAPKSAELVVEVQNKNSQGKKDSNRMDRIDKIKAKGKS